MKNVIMLLMILMTISCNSEKKQHKLLSLEELNDAEYYFGLDELENVKEIDSVYVYLVKEEDLNSDNKLPDELLKYENIQLLSFRNLSLTKLNFHDLIHFQNLQNLNLSRNKLDKIDKEISELKNLKVLSIEENNISELPDELHQLTKLEKLYIGYNPISSEELLKFLSKKDPKLTIYAEKQIVIDSAFLQLSDEEMMNLYDSLGGY
ncbi:leucine-rich repeat domain-containing protein [Marinigracilibium pacificum]|uniref:Leucine-rich repeat domain-containing protein n=1 Tax=Marinigracilibium pacificum TaxID=2729599 RepID=A0A848J2V6_9BACT|nr:leucine-rich repeat domain-containing protein [Marinigracilibium pacificum]NMM50061.1 leucine-rich repeat domain-containing protein [Marinigracilibium pacificum]